jgi:hypothetical protein
MLLLRVLLLAILVLLVLPVLPMRMVITTATKPALCRCHSQLLSHVVIFVSIYPQQLAMADTNDGMVAMLCYCDVVGE